MSRVLVRQGLVSTGAQVLGRSANFALPFLVVYQFGVSITTDTLFLVFAVSLYIGGTLSNAASDAIVVELTACEKGKSIRRFTRLSIVISFVGLTVLWLFLSQNYQIFGFVLIAAGFFIALFGLLSSYYVAACHKRKNFVVPGVSWSYRWLALLPLLFVSDAALGVALFIAAIALADGVRFWHLKRVVGSPPTGVRELELKGVGSYVLAAASTGLNPIVDRMIAGTLPSGAVTAVELAERATGLILLVPTIGLLQVINVEINEKIGLDKEWDYRRLLFHTFWLSSLWALTFVIIVKLPIFAEIIGSFDIPYTLADVKTYIIILLASLPATFLGMVLVRILVAYRRGKLVLFVAVGSVVLNAVLSYWMSLYLGVQGILLATLFVYSFTAISLLLLCASFRRA